MPNYSNSKIYKLWSPEGDEIYIGSTTQTLKERKRKHTCKKNNCSSKILFQKYNDVRMDLLLECPCENKFDLHKIEREFIKNNNNCVNIHIPLRTDKEYYQDNKEKIQKYQENNKEKIKEYQKQYNKNNKEQLAEQKKHYNENNKEYLKNYYNQKITCECGCVTSPNNIKRHQKSPKHIKLMEKII